MCPSPRFEDDALLLEDLVSLRIGEVLDGVARSLVGDRAHGGPAPLGRVSPADHHHRRQCPRGDRDGRGSRQETPLGP
ncbi:hypothetical protein STENM36S_03663 [Streptomyces tendae]